MAALAFEDFFIIYTSIGLRLSHRKLDNIFVYDKMKHPLASLEIFSSRVY